MQFGLQMKGSGSHRRALSKGGTGSAQALKESIGQQGWTEGKTRALEVREEAGDRDDKP